MTVEWFMMQESNRWLRWKWITDISLKKVALSIEDKMVVGSFRHAENSCTSATHWTNAHRLSVELN